MKEEGAGGREKGGGVEEGARRGATVGKESGEGNCQRRIASRGVAAARLRHARSPRFMGTYGT